jgi:integrase
MPRYKKQKDGRYKTRIKVGTKPDGKPSYKYASGATLKEFEANKAELLKRYAGGADEIERDVLFGTYAEEWYVVYKKPHIASSNAKTYRCILDAHILPVFEDRQLRSIRKAELQVFVNERAALKESYVKKIVMIIKQIFRAAMDDGIIDRDPSARLIMPARQRDDASANTYIKPRPGYEPRRALTGAENEAVLHSIGSEPNGIWVALLYYLGLRPGEALGLRWGDIDFKARLVHIERDVDYSVGPNGQIGALKNERSYRYVPAPIELITMLQLRRGLADVYIVQSPETGQWMRSGEQEQLWERLMRRAYDIDKSIEHRPSAVCRRRKPRAKSDEPEQPLIYRSILTPYYLRHNYATKLYWQGVDAMQASEWMGNKPETMIKFYTHLDEERKKKGASIADGVFAVSRQEKSE